MIILYANTILWISSLLRDVRHSLSQKDVINQKSTTKMPPQIRIINNGGSTHSWSLLLQLNNDTTVTTTLELGIVSMTFITGVYGKWVPITFHFASDKFCAMPLVYTHNDVSFRLFLPRRRFKDITSLLHSVTSLLPSYFVETMLFFIRKFQQPCSPFSSPPPASRSLSLFPVLGPSTLVPSPWLLFWS